MSVCNGDFRDQTENVSKNIGLHQPFIAARKSKTRNNQVENFALKILLHIKKIETVRL